MHALWHYRDDEKTCMLSSAVRRFVYFLTNGLYSEISEYLTACSHMMRTKPVEGESLS